MHHPLSLILALPKFSYSAIKWHVNDGEEVFAVLDGIVDMHYRETGIEKMVTLNVGDVLFAGVGCEHVAHPRGEVRVLVVEREGSV